MRLPAYSTILAPWGMKMPASGRAKDRPSTGGDGVHGAGRAVKVSVERGQAEFFLGGPLQAQQERLDDW